MFVRRDELTRLSADVRRIIDGQAVDLRDNLEGRLSVLKNDIHTLAGKLNEQAAHLQQEKSAMADTLADISHQLKTPLTAMSVMVDLLENAPPEKATAFIRNLKQGLAQTNWLANALLKMAKLDAGNAAFTPVEITAGVLCEAALQPLQILMDIKNQQIQWKNEAAASHTLLRCDKNWTAEALTNILKNASEHSPEGSVITLDAGVNPLCRWVSVTDAGPGIKREALRGLFQRFATTAQNATREETARDAEAKQRHGIGLPLAMAIMRGQNGDIEVDGGGPSATREGGAAFLLKFYS